jgi:uncharacterized membrane protein
LKGLEEEVGKGQRELARLSTQLEIKVGTIADEDSKVHKVQKAVEDVSIISPPKPDLIAQS